MSTRILVVCSANVRRSPAIAGLLRAGTASVGGLTAEGITVSSRGTAAAVGQGADALLTDELKALGIDLSDHVARQLAESDIARADLIVAAEREHRRAVVSLVPDAVTRTFTLRELAALSSTVRREELHPATDTAAARLHELVRRVPRQRASRVIRDPRVDDLADLKRPTRRSTRRLVGEMVGPAETILQLVLPERPVIQLPTAQGDTRATDTSSGQKREANRPAG